MRRPPKRRALPRMAHYAERTEPRHDGRGEIDVYWRIEEHALAGPVFRNVADTSLHRASNASDHDRLAVEPHSSNAAAQSSQGLDQYVRAGAELTYDRNDLAGGYREVYSVECAWDRKAADR